MVLTNECAKAGIGMQTQRTHSWTQWGKESGGRIERVARDRAHYHMQNREPVGVCSNRCSVKD